MSEFSLIEICLDGQSAMRPDELPAAAAQVGQAYVELYRSAGFAPPWIGYFALERGGCVGTCGFKGPPQSGGVEIAYCTFPPHEGRGIATRMARALIEMAWRVDPDLTITAQTLPAEGPSTAILRRLGFTLSGSVDHPDDGRVWHWELAPQALSRRG